MPTHYSTNLARLSAFLSMLTVLLAACAPVGQPTPIAPSVLPATAAPSIAPTEAPLPAPTVAPTVDWQVYRNVALGYTVTYPAAWTVVEHTDPALGTVTTFAPASGDGGVDVIVQTVAAVSPEPSDLPNQRCQRVSAGGLSGQRCFDTISFSLTTKLIGHGRTYTIAASGKRVDPNLYQHFLDNFAPVP
jgi:hypothetical protein